MKNVNIFLLTIKRWKITIKWMVHEIVFLKSLKARCWIEALWSNDWLKGLDRPRKRRGKSHKKREREILMCVQLTSEEPKSGQKIRLLTTDNPDWKLKTRTRARKGVGRRESVVFCWSWDWNSNCWFISRLLRCRLRSPLSFDQRPSL